MTTLNDIEINQQLQTINSISLALLSLDDGLELPKSISALIHDLQFQVELAVLKQATEIKSTC